MSEIQTGISTKHVHEGSTWGQTFYANGSGPPVLLCRICGGLFCTPEGVSEIYGSSPEVRENKAQVVPGVSEIDL
jgi:hypothetical protein